ncbi:hypothetical protein F5050DRAFT_1122714 [Lentinula boryana]|uniref:GST N-terminal domain-containing protein n=1 Tax=Lentinula boryana TaxID=40481 RepID=A0ABQ8PZD0_9AGAR|nr:hypothetical protein F5050DRAFT_1122714 [Lentinula boryana]
MITLYDFAWKFGQGVCWNPHVGKLRYCLNYKGLQYKTIWIEYPDVKATIETIGAKSTGLQPTGEPWYTIPAIVDDATGVALAESVDIVEYLDNTYPNTPRLIPEGTHALQAAFRDAFYPKLAYYYPFLVPITETVLNPPSATFFRAKYEAIFGKKLENVYPEGQERVVAWNKWKEAIGGVDAWMKKDDIWMMGNTPSFADFILASFILSAKTLFGADSQEYKEVLEMHDGRWGRLAKNVESYNRVL